MQQRLLIAPSRHNKESMLEGRGTGPLYLHFYEMMDSWLKIKIPDESIILKRFYEKFRYCRNNLLRINDKKERERTVGMDSKRRERSNAGMSLIK